MRYYLWIGSYMSPDIEKQMKEQIGYQKSSSILSQRNILKGIEKVVGETFDSIGAVVMHGWPIDRCLFIPRKVYEKENKKKDILVGYLNIIYLNKVMTNIQLKREVKRWVQMHSATDEIDVFIYEIRSACILAALYIKKRFPFVRLHLIVPDLPLFMDLHMNIFKRILKSFDWYQTKRCLKQIDDYFLYTSTMAQYLGLQNGQWMLMEGSFDNRNVFDLPIIENSKKNIIMYSGSINTRFGILNLIDAMKLLPDKFELWITGFGSDITQVKKAIQGRTNIKYYGYIEEQERVLQLQLQATALINMRDPREEASKYCFPSKLFEYMITGKPVLSCRLEGIPEEYFKYLLEMDSLMPEDIATAILRLDTFDKEYLYERGIAGRNFILNEKNNIIQASKMMKWLGII